MRKYVATEPPSGALLTGHVNMGRSVKGVSVTLICPLKERNRLCFSYNAAAIFDVCISVITDPLTYLQKQSTETTLPIKECSQRRCAPCGCDGE